MALWVIITLLVPNVILDCTETYSTIWKITNIALPAGIYLLILVCHRRTGWPVILMLPVMFFAAFQMVLLYLYGESIIAVDMYLNVVTTNMSEASELLGNLTPAIILVLALYLPPIAWGIYAILHHMEMPCTARRELALWGASLTLFGLGLGLVSISSGRKGSFRHNVFPVNVVANLCEAVTRTRLISAYPGTSADFTYHARSIRPATDREIYVYVIGETSRALNWQLYGYDRPTNPRLSKVDNLVFFDHAISESNTTHKSVPMLMSSISSERFDSINNCKSIITAMKEAGFYTHFFSNQAPNNSYTEYFGNEADDTRYTDTGADPHPYDDELVEMVHQAIADTTHCKQFIVLHTYGSHFKYRDRYPDEFSHFTPDDPVEAAPSTRWELLNAYDNAIRFTDYVLASLVDELRMAGCPTGLIYSADHGEDIYDDTRNRLLHASPNPTYYQLHVAMLAWLSDEFIARHPEIIHNLRDNCHRYVSPQKSMFNTAIDICGVVTPRADRQKSLAGGAYNASEPVYLTDLNTAVPINESGVKQADVHNLARVTGRHIHLAQNLPD